MSVTAKTVQLLAEKVPCQILPSRHFFFNFLKHPKTGADLTRFVFQVVRYKYVAQEAELSTKFIMK